MKIISFLFCIMILLTSTLCAQISATDSVRVELKDRFAFTNNNNNGYVRFDPISHTPRSFVGFWIDKYSGTPVQIADSFLNENKSLFGIDDVDKELQLVKNYTTTRGNTKLRFVQRHLGVRVYKAGISLSINDEGVIYDISCRLHPYIDINLKPTLSTSEAETWALTEITLSNTFGFSNTKLMIYPQVKSGEYQYSLVYKVNASSTDNREQYSMLVDAENGGVIYKWDFKAGVTGTGSVWVSDPDHSNVTYENLNNLLDLSPRKLWSSNLKIFNDDLSEATSSTAYFVYDSTNSHFAEVMAYYHCDEFEEWMIDEMGMSTSLIDTFVICKVHHATHHAQTLVGIKEIHLGDADTYYGLNAAYHDASVIAHEYMHIVTFYHDTLSGTPVTSEESAMDEAYSDFFAVCYMNEHHTTSIFAEYIDNSATYTWYRDLDNTKNYDDFGLYDWYGLSAKDKYDNSLIFSGALWDFRTDANVNAGDASALVYESLTNLGNDPDFALGREKLVNEAIDWEDETEGEDVWRDDVEEAFYAHGIGTIAPTVTISGVDGLFFRQSSTWTANVSNGATPYSYQWYYKLDGTSTWTPLGTASTQYRQMGATSFTLAVSVTDDEDRTCTDTHWVEHLDLKKKAGEMVAEILVPDVFSISQNYPNPFNPETVINFGLPEASNVNLKVFNLQGQKVATLVENYLEAGFHSFSFNGENLPSGVYFYKIVAGEFTDIKRMLLIK